MEHPDYLLTYDQLEKLFTNTSVSPKVTLEALQGLKSEIETMIEGILEDLEQAGIDEALESLELPEDL